MLLELVSVPNMLLTGDDCETKPESEMPVGVIQVKVVGSGIIPLPGWVGVTLKDTPLQMVSLNGLMMAFGLRFTCRVKLSPTQFPETGVTT
jgi:hypothetical protein